MKKAKVFKDEKKKYDPEVGKRIAPDGDCRPEHRATHVENWIVDHDTRLIDDVIKTVQTMPISNRTAAQMRNEIVDKLQSEYQPQ